MTPAQHYESAQGYLIQAGEAPVGSDYERFALQSADVHAQLAMVGTLALDKLTAQKHRGNPLIAAILDAVTA